MLLATDPSGREQTYAVQSLPPVFQAYYFFKKTGKSTFKRPFRRLRQKCSWWEADSHGNWLMHIKVQKICKRLCNRIFLHQDLRFVLLFCASKRFPTPSCFSAFPCRTSSRNGTLTEPLYWWCPQLKASLASHWRSRNGQIACGATPEHSCWSTAMLLSLIIVMIGKERMQNQNHILVCCFSFLVDWIRGRRPIWHEIPGWLEHWPVHWEPTKLRWKKTWNLLSKLMMSSYSSHETAALRKVAASCLQQKDKEWQRRPLIVRTPNSRHLLSFTCNECIRPKQLQVVGGVAGLLIFRSLKDMISDYRYHDIMASKLNQVGSTGPANKTNVDI